MAGNTCHTSCGTHSFDYTWTIEDLKTRVDSRVKLNSPFFYPDFTIEGHKTRWDISFTCTSSSYTSYSSYSSMNCLSVQATMSRHPDGRYGSHKGIFAEGSISILVPRDFKEASATSPILKVAKTFQIGTEAAWLLFDHSFNASFNIKSSEITAGKSQYTYNNSLTVRLNMKVYLLDQPRHDVVAQPIHVVPKFDLPKAMEDARVNDIFTNVILVSGEREFKAHRVILASQSPFFKARFEQRWKRQDDKVDMSDVDPNVLEAMISFMYTGEVVDMDSISDELLPVSEEYRLSGLKEMCERSLLKKLSTENAVKYLKLATTHNAENLRKESLRFIISNPSSVKKSENWKSLDKSDPVRAEIVEAWIEKLV